MLALTLFGVGCGSGGSPTPPPGQGLYLVNYSQFPLDVVHIHSGPEDYEILNRLTAPPLAEGTFQPIDDFDPGLYVTVIRKLSEHGDSIALTTSEPIDYGKGPVDLWVFDEGFRLIEPSEIADTNP